MLSLAPGLVARQLGNREHPQNGLPSDFLFLLTIALEHFGHFILKIYLKKRNLSKYLTTIEAIKSARSEGLEPPTF